MDRREFIKKTGAAFGVTSTITPVLSLLGCTQNKAVPSYLSDYAEVYRQNPKKAAIQWFQDAKFGLFLHYGLYSLLGTGAWTMYSKKIPVKEYERLMHSFTAKHFDADFITDLALEAEMKYVNLTTSHHDSFCLFDTAASDFNSVNSPAGRDLVGELAEQCAAKGLGFFCYYSYGTDWRHSNFYPREFIPYARPAYEEPEPNYKWKSDADFREYIDFCHTQIKELLNGYGPIAGMWFDMISTYYARRDLFPIEETYTLIRSIQPQTLISFKMGANGDEDFAAPERENSSLYERMKNGPLGIEGAEYAKKMWEANLHKPHEICDTLEENAWGWVPDQRHRSTEETLAMLRNARSQNSNLLLNTGPLPDGSIHPQDVKTLREVGQWIRKNGWPEGDVSTSVSADQNNPSTGL